MTRLRRRSLLGAAALLSLGLAGCGGDETAAELPPLRYDYLTPIRLNVASVGVDERWTPSSDDIGASSPVPPDAALRQMAADRLVPVGSSGRATLVIEDASIRSEGDQYLGHFKVRLDIYTDAPAPAAYAEASVSRTRTEGDSSQRQAVYDLTRKMMDDINVEFEYQVRHALQAWLQGPAAPAAAPGPIEEQTLPPPKS